MSFDFGFLKFVLLFFISIEFEITIKNVSILPYEFFYIHPSKFQITIK